ncbi:hypothetical protein P3T76_012620 [Phytophthora citrophthora]|uniref:Serine protease n=1 Tax=Phytophthora citrophthora TaxID=4793 RepID=A0AAD9LD73_9STRA|nr:hypothetical protein P3T76_012620 [Phytophthora citrophthora]
MAVQQEERQLSIFGKDGREQISDPNAYPYNTVGVLQWGTDVVCTGTLVATNIILTAAECVLDLNGELRDDSKGSSIFTLSETTEVQTASVVRVHKQSDFWTKWTQNTYVLVELDEDLGTTNGVLHLPTANSFAQDKAMTVQLVDYGSTEEAGECYQMCKIHFPSEFGGPDYMLHHDCDVSAKRSAGSPMLIRSTDLETYVVGIHTNAIGDDPIEDTTTTTYSSYNDTVANRGVLGSFVQPHLEFLLRQNESSSTSLDPSSSLGFPPTSSSSLSSSTITSDSSGSSSNNPEKDDPGASGPASASSSSVETSVSSPQGIASTAAYTCIGAVCASWLAIIFVAARKFRASR